MILQALNGYYERLAATNDSNIPLYGFAPQNISFCLAFDPQSESFDVEDYRLDQKGNPGRPIVMPTWGGKISSNVKAQLLWGKPAYVLGADLDGKPERTEESHADFCRLCKLFFSRLPKELVSTDIEQLLLGLSADWRNFRYADEFKAAQLFTLKIAGGRSTLPERIFLSPEACSVWCEIRDSGNDDQGQCLVTGLRGAIALTHPIIKGARSTSSALGGPGVLGSEKPELALVSFNKDKTAFASFDKIQNLNAPVSKRAAFQYTTALNHLLRAGSRQRLVIGQTTMVFWSERASPAEDLFSYLIDPVQRPNEADDPDLNDRIRTLIGQVSEGIKPSELGDTNTRFFVLGLAPRSTRISVGFWQVSNLGDLLERIADHYKNLGIESGKGETEFPSVWQLLDESVPLKKGKPDRDKILQSVGGAMLRSILTGGDYPLPLIAAVLRRIRVDGFIDPFGRAEKPQETKQMRRSARRRAAILKAFLIRNHHHIITMSLDVEKLDSSYRLGRLFAALEKTQEDALPKINTTIRDRFYSSASATPRTVFPLFLRMYSHHLSKALSAWAEQFGPEVAKKMKVNRERLVQEILNPLQDFPRHLNLEGQSQFALGYYHQRQNFFTAKPKTDDATPA